MHRDIEFVLICSYPRLIACGSTVDEAAFLFYSLDQACHGQLLAEAAAANGVQKKIIPHDVAQYTAASMQSAVSLPRVSAWRSSQLTLMKSTTSITSFNPSIIWLLPNRKAKFSSRAPSRLTYKRDHTRVIKIFWTGD